MEDPNSILDTDLYKLTMHYVVWSLYPDVHVTYGFINRSKSTQPFTRSAYQNLCKRIECLKTRILTDEEKDWLSLKCGFFPSSYLDYLKTYRFRPDEQLELKFHPHKSSSTTGTENGQPTKSDDLVENGAVSEDADEEEKGDLEILIKGLWSDTILYEVPLLSMVSEAYFETVDREWSYESQTEKAKSKAEELFSAGCKFSEFGTRRRRSWKTQSMVIEGIKQVVDNNPDYIFSTSNVWMARHYNIKPVGTMAHELIMAEGALGGYQGVNMRVLTHWEKCFPNNPELWIALTDTFGTKPFFDELVKHPEIATRWTGIRQDSGDPETFASDAIKAWELIGIDPKTKFVIFSDGLDVGTCCQLRKFCESKGLKEIYGIGTHLTNDFLKEDSGTKKEVNGQKVQSKALNIVIKLLSANDKPCVKLSDVIEKAIGPQEEIDRIRSILHI
ncbi:nicotinate phosphoribosyltransferase [Puccinia graminis f. sp. tritici]|uniref:Nicotinate phosphoribosyltransferase n=1 Tax=Puccinia graminis f. sp. tritici TaxID=56615 RepID=A0A5B0R9D2_PUCGR|nr:nicotinate phosphoribosyltransferase [Puccinia graminis f. sp. tritici]